MGFRRRDVADKCQRMTCYGCERLRIGTPPRRANVAPPDDGRSFHLPRPMHDDDDDDDVDMMISMLLSRGVVSALSARRASAARRRAIRDISVDAHTRRREVHRYFL